MAEEPGLLRSFDAWGTSRDQHNVEKQALGTEAAKEKWQKDYYQGRNVEGPTGRQIIRSSCGCGRSDRGAFLAPRRAALLACRQWVSLKPSPSRPVSRASSRSREESALRDCLRRNDSSRWDCAQGGGST
jgi:hypothetical protein